jgi:hypothetical protein
VMPEGAGIRGKHILKQVVFGCLLHVPTLSRVFFPYKQIRIVPRSFFRELCLTPFVFP